MNTLVINILKRKPGKQSHSLQPYTHLNKYLITNVTKKSKTIALNKMLEDGKISIFMGQKKINIVKIVISPKQSKDPVQSQFKF